MEMRREAKGPEVGKVDSQFIPSELERTRGLPQIAILSQRKWTFRRG